MLCSPSLLGFVSAQAVVIALLDPKEAHSDLVMPAESGRMLSHYRLLEEIGRGGMGVVWKAEDTVLGRTVAIKVLPADVARDEKRRHAMAMADHCDCCVCRMWRKGERFEA